MTNPDDFPSLRLLLLLPTAAVNALWAVAPDIKEQLEEAKDALGNAISTVGYLTKKRSSLAGQLRHPGLLLVHFANVVVLASFATVVVAGPEILAQLGATGLAAPLSVLELCIYGFALLCHALWYILKGVVPYISGIRACWALRQRIKKLRAQ